MFFKRIKQIFSYIILKCSNASLIAASFSGGHFGCLVSSDIGLLQFSLSVIPYCAI